MSVRVDLRGRRVIKKKKKGDEQLENIKARINPLVKALKSRGVSVKFDFAENQSPGFKFAEYELKGVPVRIAVGARDTENGTVEIARRDTGEKSSQPQANLDAYLETLLEDIQQAIYKKALTFREENICPANSYDEFKRLLDEQPGFISAHWDGTPETEQRIKEETKATIRCIPLNNTLENGLCILTGKPSTQRVLFARAY